MKNLSDLMPLIENLKTTLENEENEVKSSLFELYDSSPEISGLFKSVENCKNGFYFFDDFGLCYGVPVPEKIAVLPFINDFLTQDFHHIDKGYRDQKEIVLSQSMGPAIAINHNHGRGEIFVFDQESGEIIIEKKLSWMTEKYLAAKIELFQHKWGCFGDVVEIDYYGGYLKHFDTFKALEIKTETTREILTQIVENAEKNEEN